MGNNRKLKLKILEQYRDEILKAEVGALLFNLGKTHIGFSFWRDYFPHKSPDFKFSSYKEYPEKYFYSELEQVSPQLKIFFENINVNLGFLNTDFMEVLKGKESKEEFIQKIFFRGCENINSGIDKGSPNKRLKPSLWLSNAFGSFKEEVKEHNFDQRRLCFYTNLSTFLSKHGYFQNPNWSRIRNFILEEIKNWYSQLLSDSRFPVNDVSLFDQAYMTASMFKAVLAQLVMDDSKRSNYIDNPSSIKWRILGIQYDKMGIAEKSLKLASISWYRNIAKEIDNEIKELIEVKYPIGNEIYRDETGIYFIVGEDLGEDLNNESNLARLRSELHEIEEKILEIFKIKTEDEFYPAIFLTKASRGLMNLSYLLETAKDNFLKQRRKEITHFEFDEIKYKGKLYKVKKGKNFIIVNRKDSNGNKIEEKFPNTAIGICPVCQVRLIYKEDKERGNDPTICKVCYKRIYGDKGRVKNWIDNTKNNRIIETIWTEEIKDKNDRIAYVSLKFELQDWLNGNILNSLIVNKNNFPKLLRDIKLSILSEDKLLQKLQNLLDSYFKQITLKANLFGLSINGNMLSNRLPTSERRNIGKIISVFNALRKQNLYTEFNKYINQINAKLQTIFSSSSGLFETLKQIEGLIGLDTDIQNFEKFLKNEGNGFGKIDENTQFLERYKSIPEIKQLLDEILVYKKNIDLAKKILRKKNKQIPELEKLAANFVPFSISKEILKYYHQYGNLKNFYQEMFFNSTIGTKWEEWIKSIIPSSKIDWENEKINCEKFTDKNDPDLDLLATLLLQFLLRKNPSPARLRRIWETTKEFFERIHNELNEILNIPKWRKKRLIFTVNENISGSKEFEGEGLLFWAVPDGNKTKIYLITSIIDFLEKCGNNEVKDAIKEYKEKKDSSKLDNILSSKDSFIKFLSKDTLVIKEFQNNENGEKIKIKFKNLSIETYKPYMSIIDPTPVSWQFIIPAEYVPNLIDKVLKRYNKNFKYVYGKLPLHIGIVIANYKKPVYIGLKALRKIRRDVKDIDKFNELYIQKEQKEFAKLLRHKTIYYGEEKERKNETDKYYSLYWDNQKQMDYNFYIKPTGNWKKWISTINKFDVNSKVQIIPNTFDFEYLDHNIRRTEIAYTESGKRLLPLKSNRPYELEVYWRKFKAFRDLAKETNLQTNRLHKLVEILYSKVQYGNFKEEDSFLLTSSFINWLELNKKKNAERRKLIKKIFDLNADYKMLSKEFIEQLREKLKKKENILLFIDMFEFWHTALKEV